MNFINYFEFLLVRHLDSYEKVELTVDAGTAQLQALKYFIPFLILFGLPYFLLWRSNLTIANFKNSVPGFGLWLALIIIGVLLFGIIIHELLHGLTWSLFAKEGLKSIKYGILWKVLTPYCHCSEPLLVKHYIIGGLMPGIILGILPSIVAIVTGSPWLFIFGLFFTLAAGGDFMIVNLLKNEPKNNLVQDHPSKIGCYIFRPKNINAEKSED